MKESNDSLFWLMILGGTFAALMSACSSKPQFVDVPLTYYGLDPEAGKLLSDKVEDDITLSFCNRTVDKTPCVVIKSDDFFEFKKNHELMKDELEACQSATSK